MQLTARRAGLAAGMVVLTALAFGAGWWGDNDVGRRLRKLAPNTAEWKVPEQARADLSADVGILEARQPFGAAKQPSAAGMEGAAPGPATPPAVEWRIGGIITTEKNRQLVVLVRQHGQGAERSEWRQVGETLPDGSIIRSVDQSSITVERQGAPATIRMFVKN
jgi:hypothetical protein